MEGNLAILEGNFDWVFLGGSEGRWEICSMQQLNLGDIHQSISVGGSDEGRGRDHFIQVGLFIRKVPKEYYSEKKVSFWKVLKE